VKVVRDICAGIAITNFTRSVYLRFLIEQTDKKIEVYFLVDLLPIEKSAL